MTAVSDYELVHEYETVNYHRRGGAAEVLEHGYEAK